MRNLRASSLVKIEAALDEANVPYRYDVIKQGEDVVTLSVRYQDGSTTTVNAVRIDRDKWANAFWDSKYATWHSIEFAIANGHSVEDNGAWSCSIYIPGAIKTYKTPSLALIAGIESQSYL